MSDRKLANAAQALFRQVVRLYRNLSKGVVTWLLRTAFVTHRRGRFAAGFVLPTTVLLILVVALTVGALTFRAFNTSNRTIGDIQSKVIYNAATPAIDRARAKLEFLFDDTKETRYNPGSVPPEDYLLTMLINDGQGIRGGTGVSRLAGENPTTQPDAYTLRDETRIDLNGDGRRDNAWVYRDPSTKSTVIYSITLATPRPEVGAKDSYTVLASLPTSTLAAGPITATTPGAGASAEPANSGISNYVRSGPVTNASASACNRQTSSTQAGQGWLQDPTSSAIQRKRFQIDAFVVPDNAGDPGRPNNFTTLEMAQDRQQDLGNKWGAWFRNDMEIFPGPQFNWNGAMHTEGSLIIGNNSFSAYLISSPASCLFFESASEITVTNVTPSSTQTEDFLGAIASGRINSNTEGGSSLIYLHSANPKTTTSTLDSGRDWMTGGSPWNIASSARAILLRDGYQANNGSNNRANVTVNQNFRGRFAARYEPAPYVDDLYRADDRYGPKKVYKKNTTDGVVPDTVAMGSLIPTTNTTLTRLVSEDPTRDPGNVGLDGYWERRARNEGLRLIVGQRLELGDTNGWVAPQDRPSSRQPDSYQMDVATVNGDGLFQLRNPSYSTVTAAEQADPFVSDNEGDPLYPPNVASTSHEARQRRTLRDNIAAAQSLAVYHAAVDPDYPLACMASTAHPGSPISLRQSINFVPTFFKDGATANDTLLLTDFFQGRGTNGWEFQPPTKAEFVQAMDDADSPWRVALKNLAQFAGDYVSETRNGAFPPTQEAGQIHPAPELAMWGNFSDLRRTLARMEGGATYASLSIADKTNLQTAACTLGMLAYNVDQVLKFDPSNPQNDVARGGVARNVVFELASDLYSLIDGINNPASGNFEVLEKANLNTYSYDPTVPDDAPILGNYNARDYDYVPAEAFLGKLREKLEWQYLNGGSVPGSSNPKYRMAELIFSHFQIRRDRVYGFRPSPAAYTWNYNPYYSTVGGVVQGWSSACDPNIFTFLTADPKVRQSQYASMNAFKTANPSANGFLALPEEPRFRLALSRLCGTVIPPGAIRDYPGDINYPPFRDDDYGPETRYLPQPSSAPTGGNNSNNAADRNGSHPEFIDVGRISAQGNDASRFPWNILQSPGNSGGNGSVAAYYKERLDPHRIYYKRAMVAPKWPSLYYLFPEFDHSHVGALQQLTAEIPTSANDSSTDINFDGYRTDYNKYVDHRQPTGSLGALNCPANGTTCQVETTALVNVYQPWAEPYVTNPYIRNTVNATATYRKIDDSAIEVGKEFLGYQIQMPNYVIPSSAPKNGGKTLRYTLRAFDTAAVPATSLSSIALKPRKMPSAVGSNPGPLVNNEDWKLPIAQAPTSPLPQNIPPNRILVPNANNSTGRVAIIPFLDRVIYNGRERMPVRVLDLDIGLMRRSPAARDVNTDVLLPISGIVYAFREDAVREDAIERPAGTNSYNDATAGTDPPLQSTSATNASATNRVSTKVIDFYADPERRPYGFRLRNGSQLQRHLSLISDSGPITPDLNIRGLSLFTDNPVYVMGDYNLHQDGAGSDNNNDNDRAGNPLEEFRDTRLQSLNQAYNEDEFYDRRQIDSNFALPTVDRWRPSEILSDAVTIISENFCDGSILDTVMTAGQDNGASLSETSDDPETVGGVTFGAYRRVAGTTGAADIYDDQQNGLFGPSCNSTNSSNRTSFLNQGRPVSEPPYGSPDNKRWWMRDNPADRFSPIKVSRNGALLVYPNPGNRAETPSTNNTLAGMKPRVAGLYSGNYYDMVRGDGAGNTDRHGRALIPARDTKVNSIVVSGLSPSQVNQSYGGLHNFPRFIETWSGRNLWFAGSLLQLSFSNYASTPFDQDAWEPGVAPTGSEIIPYYSPPNRLWGYDVGLQFAQAGPAASRFVTPGKVRNEFYSEPAANDPYMNKLCTALKTNAPTGTSLNNLRCPT